LLRTLFINMAAAGASEIAIDAGTDLLSAGLAGKISARAGQGVGVGILTARLWLQAVRLLRPLPWVPERKAKLTSVRKAIVSRVLGLMKTS
jgi:putative membrane protein